MHEHDRDTAGLVRVQHEQPFPQICVADREVAGAKTSDLEIPNRRPFQTQGEGRIVSYSMGTSTPSILSDLPESGV